MNASAAVPADRKAEDLVEGQKCILGLINSGTPLPQILDAICSLVDSQTEGMYSSVLLVDEAGQRLLHGAAPHLPEAYCEAIHGIRIGDGVGSCGTAAARGEQVVVEDITTHPYWADFKALAFDTHGLASCWSTPIRAWDGRIVATFALYHRVPKSPSAEELSMINSIAHLVAIAIERAPKEPAAASS